jgi:hypothetical protein
MSELDRFSKLKFTYSQKNKTHNLNNQSIIQQAGLKIMSVLKRWKDQRKAIIEQYSQKMLKAQVSLFIQTYS